MRIAYKNPTTWYEPTNDNTAWVAPDTYKPYYIQILLTYQDENSHDAATRGTSLDCVLSFSIFATAVIYWSIRFPIGDTETTTPAMTTMSGKAL